MLQSKPAEYFLGAFADVCDAKIQLGAAALEIMDDPLKAPISLFLLGRTFRFSFNFLTSTVCIEELFARRDL